MPSIDALDIADEPAAWSAAGFDVEDARCRVSRMTLNLTGKGARRGIVGWTLGEESWPTHWYHKLFEGIPFLNYSWSVDIFMGGILGVWPRGPFRAGQPAVP